MKMKNGFPSLCGGARLFPLACLSLLLALPGPARPGNGPDLSVTKTCAANGPQSILCTVTVTNIGAAPTLAPLTLSDTPSAPAGSTYTGAGGSLPISCSLGAGPVLPIPCSANISLQPQQSGTALFSFHVPDGGAFSNCVTATIPRNAANPGDLSPADNTDICTSLGGGTGTGDGGRGKVTFAKKVINDTRFPTPGSFDIKYQCDPDMSTVVALSLAAPGYQQTVAVARGAACKFTEVQPQAPKGCRWITTYPNGQYGKDGDRLVVQNELSCPGTGGGDGNITFVKKIVNNSPNRVTGPFQVEVKCNPAVQPSMVVLSGPGFQQSLAVSPRAECKFQEVMPKAPEGCKWSVDYPDGQVAHAGDTRVIVNTLDCGGGPASCPAGQSTVTFPGSDTQYCCNGKPGDDKFCCTVARPRPLPAVRKR